MTHRARTTKQRMRRGAPAPSPAAAVLRGGGIDRDVLRTDAETNFAVYGFYGLSVWIPADASGEDVLLSTKLLKSRMVRRFVAADLIARGLELWDAGQTPHYDLVYLRGTEVDALGGCRRRNAPDDTDQPVPRPGRRPRKMIYIDLDADLNVEDDDGRNFARVAPPASTPAVGDVLVAGRTDFWSWVVIDHVDGEIVYFEQVSARRAAGLATLVADMPRAV